MIQTSFKNAFRPYAISVFSVLLLAATWNLTGKIIPHSTAHLTTARTSIKNALVLALYYLTHSLLAHPPVRERWLGTIATEARRGFLALNFISSAALFLLWDSRENSAITIALDSQLIQVLCWAINGLGAIGFIWTLQVTQLNEFLGVTSPKSSEPLVVTGPYRYCRHPMYFFGMLLMITPNLTTHRIVFIAITLIYIDVGSRIEELKLQTQFGDLYRSYKKTTARIIPFVY